MFKQSLTPCCCCSPPSRDPFLPSLRPPLRCPAAQVSETISTFVATAEAAARDMLPEQVAVPSVTELSREAFVAGVSNTQAVRDHIKVGCCMAFFDSQV